MEFPAAAQWVRLESGAKTPLPGVPWRRASPTYHELQDHVDAGGNGGVVPASADWREGVRLAVLDVDRGDPDALTSAYRPVALAETRRGSHAWYLSTDAPAVNATWSGPGGTGGDYRGLNGYAALHGDELAIVDAGLARIGRERNDLPIHLLNIEGHRRHEQAARRVLMNVADALARFEAALSRATAHALRGAVVGQRHPLLVRAMARWGGRRTWNGRTVDHDWLAGRCAAYWLGMPDRRTFGEVEAAGILAWVLSSRRRWLARPHRPEFIGKQRERALQQAGRARAASLFDDLSNERARPWDGAGISRRTWYRRRARAKGEGGTVANGSTGSSSVGLFRP